VRVYPPQALKTGVGGTAKLRCQVRADGHLGDCTVVAEQPLNAGFGAAALQLAPLFQIDPETRATTTVTTLPIRFGVTVSPETAAAIKDCVPGAETRPDWLRKPTAAEMAKIYPPQALRMSQDGLVKIGCTVTVEGELIDCRVVEETPEKLGFGEAALRLGPAFRMKPVTRNCESVAGAAVTIPIPFTVR
jgi:TonB family protein